MKHPRVVVVGAGVIGFSTAVCIAETFPFCSVTLMAERFSPDTTSDVAAGLLFCAQNYPDVPLERQKNWFKNTFDHLLPIAQSELSSEVGVMLISGWQIFKDVPDDKTPFWSQLVNGFRFMTHRELQKFPGYKFGHAFTTIKCECSTYLLWLEKRFRRAGGHVEQRRVTDLGDLADLCDLVVNCSGLGSESLAPDGSLYPVRGQVLQVEAPWLKHFIRAGDGMTYVYPGLRGVTLGGTRQTGDRRLSPDSGDSQDILRRCTEMEPALRGAKVLGAWVGLRPTRSSPRVEREVLEVGGGRRVNVVHNYGHGGWGVTLSWGTALDALELVRESLREIQQPAKL